LELAHLSYLGWIALGISMGFGPCFAHNTLVLVPYVGVAREDAEGALLEVLSYSAARITAYALIGGAAGAFGRIFHDLLDSALARSVPPVLFGAVLVAIALGALFYRDGGPCAGLHQLLVRRRGGAMFTAGLMTALMPCPILLAVVSVATASGSPLYGALSAGAFGLGTAIAPPLLVGPLLGMLKARAIASRLPEALRFLGAIFLFGYGLHLILSAAL